MDILSHLNKEQKQAASATSGPILVIAGAGSGKTKTLTHRIAHLIFSEKVSPGAILAVTFTNKAAEEMRERVLLLLGVRFSGNFFAAEQSGRVPMIGTFHSICARILRFEAESAGYFSGFTIFDADDSEKLLKQCMVVENISTKDFSPRLFLRIIEQAKQRNIGPEEFEYGFWRDLAPPIDEYAFLLYQRYQGELKRINACDFGDLLFQTVRLWQNHPDILARYQKQWQYIHVDEYQDTNYIQYEFCRALARSSSNLFVVGDEYQSIYSFRGADMGNILNFTRDYKNAKTVVLEENYRSTGSILALANRIMENTAIQIVPKRLWTRNPQGELAKIVEVDSEREEALYVLYEIAGLGKTEEQFIGTVYEYEDDYDNEDNGILDRVMYAQRSENANRDDHRFTSLQSVDFRSIQLNTFVVLYRTNSQSRALEEACREYDVPYRIIGGVGFYSRKEIKDMFGFLRLIANPRDRISFERAVRAVPRGIGEKSRVAFTRWLDKQDVVELTWQKVLELYPVRNNTSPLLAKCACFVELMAWLEQAAQNYTIAKFIDLTVERSGYCAHLRECDDFFEERMENIAELKTVARRYEDDPRKEGLRRFLEDMAFSSESEQETGDGRGVLTFMTVHAAKGLEFDSVFMVGMEQGLFPHNSSLTEKSELEEERRLCYVGITRARKHLTFLYARSRTLYGATLFNAPSEFIADLGEDVVEKMVV